MLSTSLSPSRSEQLLHLPRAENKKVFLPGVCVCVTLRQRPHVPQGQAQEGAWVLGTGPSPVSQHPQRFKNLISVELHPRGAG